MQIKAEVTKTMNMMSSSQVTVDICSQTDQKKIHMPRDLQLTPFTWVKEKYYFGIAVL